MPMTCSGDSAATAARNLAPADPLAEVLGSDMGVFQVARRPVGRPDRSEQMRHAGALFLEFGQRLVHALTAEG
ncbi:MAG TPA: hypothetical protein VFX93_08015, partial [Xanthomonadaceae bacterium]|nr:hypothetical protein [Xanthomonadaceae bacterium]